MAIACANRSFFHFPQVCLLLKTSKVEETKTFYIALNHFIVSPHLNLVDFPQKRCMTILSSKEESKVGFAFVGQEMAEEAEIQDPDNRPIQFYSEDNEVFTKSIALSPYFVAVLRSSSIEKTKDFYARYAICQEEQHGKGPRHYSLDWMGPFAEIYPPRKNYAGIIEFIIQTNDFSGTLNRLKEHNFNIISLENSQILLNDPDGRVIRIISI